MSEISSSSSQIPPLPAIPLVPRPPPPAPNLPCQDLLASREDYFKICVPLYEASVTGDWEAAKTILDKRRELVRFAITDNCDTALHVSASTEETKVTVSFVKNLVTMMTSEDMELQNMNHNTAFFSAAAAGNANMCMTMEYKNHNLSEIPGQLSRTMPLYTSALMGKYNTVKYLYNKSHKMTGDFWTRQNRGWVLEKCVECNFFDLALKIALDRPELAENRSVLGLLAQKPDAFDGVEEKLASKLIKSIFRAMHLKVRPTAEEDGDALKLLRIIWNHTIRGKDKLIVDDILRGPPSISVGATKYPFRIIFVAAKMGNTRFVVEFLRAYPDLIWKVDENNRSIFHIAVKRRHKDIYDLLYEIGSMRDLITPLKDKDGNNMLHLVGKTSGKMRSQMSGASLLLQRELLWFKEVEKMMPPSYREKNNNDGLTPYQLFSKENKDVVTEGLDWMKDCMVVATLIVTVAFAVAFTVPGGYNQDFGLPIYINKTSFLVFVIADAVSLFSSSTSLLVFLSILTSRHGERDLMYSLPKKLMIGLVTLFISVAAMMVTFSASFFVLYRNGLKWVPILIATFASIPVIMFGVLQFPLLVDMFRSTYDSRYLFKPRKRTLYNRNSRF